MVKNRSKNHARKHIRPRFQKRGPNETRNFNNRPNRDKMDVNNFLSNLRETDIGVTEYITKTEGFNASIKSRFSDFHVNEIDLDGNVIKLTDISIPNDLKIKDDIKQDNKDKTNEELEIKIIENGVPSEQMEQIKTIFETGDLLSAVEINVTKLSKEQRTIIHKLISQMFKGAIITSTHLKDADRFIKCTKLNKSVKYDKRQTWPWPADFTYFVLHKENIDTMNATSVLAKVLRCHQSHVVYAGTKDKRAKTSQLCCIRKCNPNDILAAAKRNPMFHVGNFQFKSDTINLGQLKGNRFRIALRNVTATDDLVNKALDNLKTKGFINYYGLQRFGNSAQVPTYDIGKAMIKADWKLACELIMKPREHENEAIQKMRTYWWETRDAAGALEMLHCNSGFNEAKILEGLVLFGKNDYFTALGGLSRNMRLLYIHSYQSLVWNKVVSRRIKEWGLELREGDLVFVDKNQMHLNRHGSNTVVQDVDISEINEEDESEDDRLENGDDPKKKIDKENNAEEMSKYKALAKPLTKEDIASGKYTIHDLVLPLPGFDILYPSNEIEKWYVEILAEDGLTIDSFKQKVKLYSLPGDYRPVVIKPESVKWRLVNYKSPTETLILSDIEELAGETLETVNKKKERDSKLVDAKPNEEEPPQQDSRAIILEFDLPSSCYATMALREVLKIDTSAASQIKLTKEAESTKRKLDETVDVEEPKKLKKE